MLRVLLRRAAWHHPPMAPHFMAPHAHGTTLHGTTLPWRYRLATGRPRLRSGGGGAPRALRDGGRANQGPGAAVTERHQGWGPTLEPTSVR